jgi:hypothetical protein
VTQGVFSRLDFDAFVLAAVDGLLFLVPKTVEQRR